MQSLSMYSGRMNADFLRGHLEGLLLAVLTDEPGHGYALSQRLAVRSGGALTVPEGSLYPALQRLERRGLVTSSWVSPDGRRRRIYQLAAPGRRQALVVARDWKVFSSAVDRVLGGLT
jgi:PadR family transcriptional regulator PadR